MAKVKVMVADDHSIIRIGLCGILNSESDIEVVAEASSGEEAIEKFKKHRPDISFLDITMPDMNGIETCTSIRKIDPEAKVIIMTMHLTEDYLNQVLAAGACGYMLKNAGKKEIISNLHKALAGDRVFSQDVADLMTESYLRSQKGQTRDPGTEKVRLTNREREILKLILDGQTNQMIASGLFISPRTVETHRANLMHKFNVNNTAALVKKALELGYAQ